MDREKFKVEWRSTAKDRNDLTLQRKIRWELRERGIKILEESGGVSVFGSDLLPAGNCLIIEGEFQKVAPAIMNIMDLVGYPVTCHEAESQPEQEH